MFVQKSLCAGILAFLCVSFLDIGLALGGPLKLDEANRAYQRHKYDQVVELLMPHLSELPRESLLQLGTSSSALKNHLLAIKVFATGVSLDAKDYEMKSLLGAEQAKAGKDQEGIQTLKEVQEANPKFYLAYKFLIEIYERRKNKYELRLLYQDLVEKFGEKPEFISKLCELTALDGLYDLSAKYCTLAITQSPKESSNFVYLGMTNKETGKTEEAEKYLKLAADSFSKSELGQLSYAQFLEEKKSYIQAFQYYQRAVLANPSSYKGLLGVANMGVEIQKLEQSLAAYSRACKLDRKALPSFRRAANTLRLAKNEIWKKKFEAAIDKCN